MSSFTKSCETNASVSFNNETNNRNGEKIQLDESRIQNGIRCCKLCFERENNKSCYCSHQEVDKELVNDFWTESAPVIIISDDEMV